MPENLKGRMLSAADIFKQNYAAFNPDTDSLSQILKKKITLFSYPFGGPGIDFNDDTIEICRKYGILKAASTENKLWDTSVNPYRIPRKIVRDWTIGEFGKQIENNWIE